MNQHPSLIPNPLEAPPENSVENGTIRIAEFEEVILLAVSGLAHEAHGPAIRHRLEAAGRKVAVGALYTTLQRLAQKRLVSSLLGEATARAGGRAKTCYTVTSRGLGALQDAERVRCALRGTPLPARSAEDRDVDAITVTESGHMGQAHEYEGVAALMNVEEMPEPPSKRLPQSQPMTPVTPQPNLQPPPARPDYLDYYTQR